MYNFCFICIIHYYLDYFSLSYFLKKFLKHFYNYFHQISCNYKIQVINQKKMKQKILFMIILLKNL